MSAKSKSRVSRPRKPESPTDTEERIRRRAHELYEQRGKVDGFALDDWLQAEAEALEEQKQRAKAAGRSK